MNVVVMIPTYNEVENIGLMLDALLEIARKNLQHRWHILVVDDTSPDGTALLVKKYQEDYPAIFLCTGPKEGLGSAMIRGYRYVLEHMKEDVVVSIDADFLFDPYDIPKLLHEIEQGADVVIGSRHSDHGFSVVGWPVGRYITHWVANTLFARWIAGGTEMHDHNSNFRAVRVKGVLDQIAWTHIRLKGYGFINFMSYVLARQTSRIVEVQVLMKWRERGESKVSFNPKYIKTFIRDSWEYIVTCFIIRFYRTFNV